MFAYIVTHFHSQVTEYLNDILRERERKRERGAGKFHIISDNKIPVPVLLKVKASRLVH